MNTASRRRCGDISTLLSETISIRFIAISRRTKIPLHHKLAKRWWGDEWHGKGKRRLHGRGRDHDLRARDSRRRLHVAAPAAGRCVVREPHGQRAALSCKILLKIQVISLKSLRLLLNQKTI